MNHLIGILFGPGTWGAGGNLVAWILCGIPTITISLWRHRRALRTELARLHDRFDDLTGGHQVSLGSCDTELGPDRDVPLGFSPPEAGDAGRPAAGRSPGPS